VADSALRTKTLYFNGIIVGEVEATGHHDRDAEAAVQFLKDKGLHKEITPGQAMFRQAVSFATTAAYLYRTDLLKAPRNGASIAPFVVNSAFSMELYLKTLGEIHNRALKGHELLKLFDSLPTEARQRIEAVLPACLTERGLVGPVNLRTWILEMNNAFVEWRYCYEKYRTSGIHIDRMIFVLKVLHEACRSAETP
jgi:hypothetical protein